MGNDASALLSRVRLVNSNHAVETEANPMVNPNHQVKGTLGDVLLIDASKVQMTPITWLWPGWLASGKLHILAGLPSAGKTTLALKFAATISRGNLWPDGKRANVGSVVIWSTEDDLEDTLTPRLVASGADLTKIKFVGDYEDKNGVSRPFRPTQDIERLAHTLRSISDLRLLIIDPVVSLVSGDGNDNIRVREALQPLVDLARTRGCAVVGISHFSKGSKGQAPMERVIGSQAFAAVARIVMVAARSDAGDPEMDRVLCIAKSNISEPDVGFSYTTAAKTISETPLLEASAINWGSPLTGSAFDLLMKCETTNSADSSASALTEAKDFLLNFLDSDAKPISEVTTCASKVGISLSTLHRARRAVGVQVLRNGKNTLWAMPMDDSSGTAAT
jgi:putative DNA primase/helicase